MNIRLTLLALALTTTPALADDPAPSFSSTPGNIIVTDAPSETIATTNDAGGVDFNWPAIERCAVKDASVQGWAGKLAMDCRIWLAARHDGFVSADSGKVDPVPTVPFTKSDPPK